jgi:hypothetical protein
MHTVWHCQHPSRIDNDTRRLDPAELELSIAEIARRWIHWIEMRTLVGIGLVCTSDLLSTEIVQSYAKPCLILTLTKHKMALN